jgi:hypothetical protein
LVVVLPAEPVTAMIFASERARGGNAEHFQCDKYILSTIIGAVSLPSDGSLPSATTSTPAPP